MNNLKYFRKKAGKTQKEMADFLNMAQAAYGNYELGKRDISTDNLTKLADYYGVSTDILLGRGSLEDEGKHLEEKAEVLPEDEVQIPLVASLRCGPGEAGKPFAYIKPVSIPKSFTRRWGTDLQALIAVGESMSPTIVPGDMLICRPGEEWEDGNVVSINLDDTDMVKRIYRAEGGGICLRSDNPKFEPIVVSASEIEDGRFHVLGRVMIPIGKEL